MTARGRDLVLLYDGLCRFCDGRVRSILARDPGGAMRFAPIQGEFARAVLARHPKLRGADSLVLVERDAVPDDERVSVRSEAALGIAEYLGGAWRLAWMLRVVPRPVRDWGYDLFARYRTRMFGRLVECRIPEGEERRRFLR